MKISKIILIVAFVVSCLGYSQNKLSGKVLNSLNEPIANAKIYLDSTYVNVQTNKKGEFEVLISNNPVMINVYSNKYGLLSSKFNNENIMNFMFLDPQKSKKEQTNKGDKVMIGYSEVDKKYQVKNVENVNLEKDKNVIVFNTIYDLIRSRLSGVTVSKNNVIAIRGVNSINNISEPLFVVDGFIVSTIDYISPMNVKSVSVLKDGAAAIYGSRASSGVILITTKQN
jgi:TonB-dependent SusC/RagA subfamily outer membrane receptor